VEFTTSGLVVHFLLHFSSQIIIIDEYNKPKFYIFFETKNVICKKLSGAQKPLNKNGAKPKSHMSRKNKQKFNYELVFKSIKAVC
jgi:hypothetical protein